VNWSTRPARPTDAEDLAFIDAAASENPWSRRQFVSACTGPGAQHESALVAEEETTLCGFVVYSLVLDEASIYNIAVLPHYQRRGLARHLLGITLANLANRGAIRALLEVRASNVAARNLYASFQFQLDSVRENYYPASQGREDAVLMSRLL
jgi:[ribosomal protein S18]-alanine N-acetyltransferase